MTYKNLKKFLTENTFTNIELLFDLMPQGVKSKVILCVGDSTGNTLSFLSSIMKECDISHSRYSKCEYFDIKNRFYRFSSKVTAEDICNCANQILKKSNKHISNECLLFICAMRLLDDSEYLLIDISEDLYKSISDKISSFAVIFALNDDDTTEAMINIAPHSTKFIAALCARDNFSYIPTAIAPCGALISYASKNKIIIKGASPIGTDFFHYDYLYHISAIDQRNVTLAHVAIETASMIFSATRPKIYKGLEKAADIYDMKLYSLSPTVLLRIGKPDFILHHRMKFEMITDEKDILLPTSDTIFCGNKEFIDKVKGMLEDK